MEVVFLIVAFLSEAVGTLVGFGSSTLLLPLSLYFFDFRTALVLTAFSHLFGNIGRVGLFKHGFDYHLLIKFGLPSAFFTVIGANLVHLVPQTSLKAALGVFLAIYALISIFKDGIKARPNTTEALLGGSVSGFVAGLIGTGGAVRGAFLSPFRLAKEKYIATAAVIAITSDLVRIPIYINNGFLNSHYMYIPLLLVVALLGSYIGKMLIANVPAKAFRKLVFVAIFVIGVKFVMDYAL